MTSARLFMAIVVGASLLSSPGPVRAHHSFAAQYDRNRPITLKGAVTKLEWTNPHIYFYMDVKETSGAVTKWSIEGGAPNTLYRAGWRKDSLKIGELVTVDGFLARDGSKLANLNVVTLADGKRVFNAQAR
jgi:hypothetical protein